MKPIEKITLTLIVLTSIVLLIFELLKVSVFPYAGLIPQLLFITMLGFYSASISNKPVRIILFIYIAITVIEFVLIKLQYTGQNGLGIIRSLIFPIVAILWLIELNKDTITESKEVKKICIAFLVFLICFIIFPILSLIAFVYMTYLNVRIIKSNDYRFLKNKIVIVKLTLLISIFIVADSLKLILLLSTIS